MEFTSTEVFISYKREYSSAFALLIEARLELAGIKAFVDRSIPGGDDWHGLLEDRVRNSAVCVCVIAPGTLESDWVKKEIQWAEDGLLLPVFHGGYDFESEKDSYPSWLVASLQKPQWIEVKEETAKDYHNAIEEILNAVRLRAG
jgi:hypothetical protein